jgi:hypothetical protein
MKPMSSAPAWWPDELGHPSSSGAQNGMRYAVFPDRKRLLIDADGTLSTYDTGDHDIGGVSQADSHGKSLAFTSQHGLVNLETLKKL